MGESPALLELVHVGCRRGGRSVLQDVSFSLRRGEVLGLLGVNGAGKSTTLAIIAGALSADTGSVRIAGHDTTAAARSGARQIGWVPEQVPLWTELTVAEALAACARLCGMTRTEGRAACARVLAQLALADVSLRLCGQLSLGQKRRLGLAQALLHAPELLVLDEPGNGLDPLQAAQLHGHLKQLAPAHGIIVSSHDLAEMQALCQRVVILHAGKVQFDGQPGNLAQQFRALASTPAEAAA